MTLQACGRGQRGSVLLIIIGVVAALAVMTTTLVLVVGNIQANTADTRTRDKAAGVAEASLDAQMYQLARYWPETATPSPAPTFDTSVVRGQFSTGEFPDPASGAFADAVYYDNSDTNGDGDVDTDDAAYDANDDAKLFVEAQGNVLNRAARFQALVERTYVSTWFPQGLAVYDGGDMNVEGSGGNIIVYNQGTSPAVQGCVAGSVQNIAVFGSGITPVTGGSVKPLNQWIPDTTINQVISMAKGAGTYYDVTAGDPMPTTEEQFSGVVVIQASAGQVIELPQNAGINMSDANNAVPAETDEPGILLLLGEPIIRFQGHTNFYGIFYSDGQLGEATGESYSGTPTFYGMVVCENFMDVRGTAWVKYDDSAIMKLRDRFTLTVVLVGNTWREIQPH